MGQDTVHLTTQRMPCWGRRRGGREKEGWTVGIPQAVSGEPRKVAGQRVTRGDGVPS